MSRTRSSNARGRSRRVGSFGAKRKGAAGAPGSKPAPPVASAQLGGNGMKKQTDITRSAAPTSMGLRPIQSGGPSGVSASAVGTTGHGTSQMNGNGNGGSSPLSGGLTDASYPDPDPFEPKYTESHIQRQTSACLRSKLQSGASVADAKKACNE